MVEPVYPRRRDVREAARAAVPAQGGPAALEGRTGSTRAGTTGGPGGSEAAGPEVDLRTSPRTPPRTPPPPVRPVLPATTGDLSLITAGDDPRGRHASGRGDGFARLAAWTVVGAALPGAGLVAAGRRVRGWLLMLPFLFVVAALVTLVATGRAVALARRFVFSPTAMLVAVGVVAAVALLWCVVIVATHVALRRERLTTGQQLLSLVLVTALVALVVLPAGTAVRYALANRTLLLGAFGHGDRSGLANPDTTAADPWAGTPRVTVLLLGADTGADRTGTRPDTIMVASIDTATGDTTLINVPRQLSDVPFPPGSAAARLWPSACKENGEGGCMINAVYLFGTEHPELFADGSGGDPGITATRLAVSTALGLQVDYQATVDLEGFQQVVDAMGGLTLDVHRRIPIGGGKDLLTGRQYPITGWIEPGDAQRLDGYHALWFARSRQGSDNDDRMARQQCVVSAAVQQYDAAKLAAAFPSLAATGAKDLQTDIRADQLNAFVDLGAKVKSGALRSLTITNANTDTGAPDYAALRAMVAQALVPPPAATAAPSASAPASAPASASAAPAPAPSASHDAHEAVAAASTC